MYRRIIPLAVAATALVACAGDVSPGELKDALVDQGIEDSLAQCIVDDLEQELTPEEFTTLARADEDLSDVSEELQATLTETVTDCATG